MQVPPGQQHKRCEDGGRHYESNPKRIHQRCQCSHPKNLRAWAAGKVVYLHDEIGTGDDGGGSGACGCERRRQACARSLSCGECLCVMPLTTMRRLHAIAAHDMVRRLALTLTGVFRTSNTGNLTETPPLFAFPLPPSMGGAGGACRIDATGATRQ